MIKAQIRGQTVLITGASPGGLGAAIARAVASAGTRLVIITARSKEKLRALKEETEARHPEVPYAFWS